MRSFVYPQKELARSKYITLKDKNSGKEFFTFKNNSEGIKSAASWKEVLERMDSDRNIILVFED